MKKPPKTPNRDPAESCPCGSARPYSDCCGPHIAGTALPPTAEALMRSRYSAYARGEAAYLIDTWHPSTRHRDLDLDPGVRWIDLRILATEAGGPGDQDGRVEFVARYKIGGRAHRLHEQSRFQRHQGRWYYVDGELERANPD